jgi:hypothetical protein
MDDARNRRLKRTAGVQFHYFTDEMDFKAGSFLGAESLSFYQQTKPFLATTVEG